MGGNAIENAERMSKQEYINICKYLKSLDNTMMITYSFDTKESYGDIDIIVINKIPIVENVSQIVKNGSLTSIGLIWNNKIHQIDFTVTSKEKQEFLHTYLSYSIFGMCLGISLNKLNLQYGSEGLKLSFSNNKTNYYLLLSKDSESIFQFLELDLNRFHQGFKDSNELLDYIFTSPYISYEILSKKTLTTKGDSRLNVIKYYKPLHQHTKTLKQDLDEIKNKVLKFFDKEIEYEEMNKEIEKRNELTLKFNGNIVMKILDNKIQGKELGNFIKSFKETYDIENMSNEEIKNNIKYYSSIYIDN